MTINLPRLKKNTGLLFIAGMLVLLTQKIGLNMPIIDAIPGMIIIIAVAMIALIIRDLFPKSIFPAFGWVTILGFIFSMPYNPYLQHLCTILIRLISWQLQLLYLLLLDFLLEIK